MNDPKFKINTPLKVWNSVSRGVFIAHYSHWNKREGKVECFRSGRTSFTEPRFTETWDFYEELNEN